MLTPVPRHGGFREVGQGRRRRAGKNVDGIPYARHWLIPRDRRPHIYTHHPVMSADEIRAEHAEAPGTSSTASLESGADRSA